MKIGLFTDSVREMSLDRALDFAVALKLDTVEFATGNWSIAPHIDADKLLSDTTARERLLSAVSDRGLTISALNANGNQLHPQTGPQHDAVVRKTIALAPLLHVPTVVLMSGLPAAPGDSWPNWITTSWPPETTSILEAQWQDVAIPYWVALAEFARREGVGRLAVEMHGNQLVYSAATLLKLREAVGDVVGANFDPSHLIWMGADPIASVRSLGPAIYHVHAKEARVEPTAATRTRLETLPPEWPRERSWNYTTLGFGQRREFWRDLCVALQSEGYNGTLSIEHEDVLFDETEGVVRSAEILREAVIRKPQSWSAQPI